MRSSLVKNTISPLKIGPASSRLFQLSVVWWPPFFFCLVEQQTRLSSDSWRSGWLTICLSRGGLRAQASYWICFGWRWHWPATQRDEVEVEKSRTEVRGISDNLILQCLDIFTIYCNARQGTQCLHVVFWRPQFFLTCLYLMATHHLCVI